jgi:flagellar hook-basal body complex protein FliE
MDISALVAQNYAASKTATAPDQAGGQNPFALAAGDFLSTMQASENIAMQAMT